MWHLVALPVPCPAGWQLCGSPWGAQGGTEWMCSFLPLPGEKGFAEMWLCLVSVQSSLVLSLPAALSHTLTVLWRCLHFFFLASAFMKLQCFPVSCCCGCSYTGPLVTSPFVKPQMKMVPIHSSLVHKKGAFGLHRSTKSRICGPLI